MLLLLAIVAGASVQAGVGIGFSIIVAPVMMVLLGTATAVPVLLLLNTIVSLIATTRRAWRTDGALIKQAIGGCCVGIVLGLLVYPLLSERVVLFLTASLLLLGLVVAALPNLTQIGSAGFHGVSGLSGLATVWAATPGPLMLLGLMLSGRSAHSARELVQPIALVAYGTALGLHGLTDWQALANAPWLVPFVGATVLGSIAGRIVGPALPVGVIGFLIRVISVIACVALYRRAYMIG